MDSSIWAILLLVVGVAFLMAEVFIPSGGVISLISAVCLLSGVYHAWTAWAKSGPIFFVAYLMVMLMMLPIGLAVAFYMWPHTKLGKQALLSGPTPDEIEAFGEIEREHAELVGRIGTTVSVLNPAGMVRIDGKRIVCQSDGSIIENGRTVKVVAARTNFVVVRAYTPSPEELAPTPPPPVTTAADAPPTADSAPSPSPSPTPTDPSPKPEPDRIDFDMT